MWRLYATFVLMPAAIPHAVRLAFRPRRNAERNLERFRAQWAASSTTPTGEFITGRFYTHDGFLAFVHHTDGLRSHPVGTGNGRAC